MTDQELKTRIEQIKRQRANDIYVCDNCVKEVDGWDVDYVNNQFLCPDCIAELEEVGIYAI